MRRAARLSISLSGSRDLEHALEAVVDSVARAADSTSRSPGAPLQ
jgi:hypothetical protein